MADPARDPKSLLTIKVLRLVRPSLIGHLSLIGDHGDLPGDLWRREAELDVTSVNGIENLCLGKFLRLPQGFGNMYLGETFSSYVCIQNESPVAVANVTCKVELQTNTQKFVLSDDKSMEEMKTGATIDIIMDHEVKEMGKHMLICTLSYVVPGTFPADPVLIERFFRFQVKKPLDVKTKLYNAENDEVYLEAQVHNITSGPMCLEKVELDPSAHFTCIPMSGGYVKNSSTTGLEEESSILNSVILGVEHSHQFLYRLTPKSSSARSASSIGKLDIVWRSSMGDKGRLQTSQLLRKPTELQDLKLVVDKVTDVCRVDVPFQITCNISNTTSDREMDLLLELFSLQEDGYVWVGLTRVKVGSLSPSSSTSLNLTVFPIRTGLISISGVHISDLNREEKFPFSDVAQVMVLSSES